MRTSVIVIVLVAAVVSGGVIFFSHQKAAENYSAEIAGLHQEIAELRDDIAQLHKSDEARRAASDPALGFNPDGTPVTTAQVLSEIKSLRAQQLAAQAELASNLTEIAVDRGSDAWARGDFKKALKLLKPLADSGNAIAQHRLGVMYVLGQGVPKDMNEAIQLFTAAADQGQGESQHSLGLRYLWGDGVDKDPTKAANWFIAAANQGIPDSATWLAEAYKWMLLAGDKFNINHKQGVTIDQFAQQLTPAQIAEAQQRVSNFVPQRTGPEDF
jgi:hypothetical protein